MSRRWRWPRSRRGAFLTVPPATPAAPPPAFPPRWLEPSGARPRRGVFLFVPPQAAVPVAYVRRRAVAWPPTRAGGFFVVPPAPIVQAPTWVPSFVRSRVRLGWRSRRGWWSVVPEAVTPPTPSVWVPAFTSSARPAAVPPRRGRFATCPPPQAQPPAPLERVRRQRGAGRRGAFVDPPWTTPPADAPTWIPDALGRNRTPSAVPRRGRCFSPPWPQAVPTPPPDWVPPRMVGRRPRPPARRGRFLPCPLVGASAPLLRAIRIEVHGPALSGPVPSGPVNHTHSVVGPDVRRHVTGPDVSRTITGTGV